ncbi:Dual specificity tyrosine-phosphorylation-regulated kinase mbk-2 [Trichinella patagoniensis]|uniref:dual-specificity kinase n=1 Tax=Trichinella patagoniensis TaxID=990121 RepID=A0A0V0ZXQ4_9BILA|nr:Dual specificity tyrosine-phosphorylation-regulated kinase mbk-2 [Trichinella patagoniensis]
MIFRFVPLKIKVFHITNRTYTILFNKFIDNYYNRYNKNRVKQLGCQRCCAEWLIRCAAIFRVSGSSEFVSSKRQLLQLLEPFEIEEVDCSDSCISTPGLDHFQGVNTIKTLRLSYCSWINDDSLYKVAFHLKDCLKAIEIVDCGCISGAGLLYLQNMTKLREIVIRDLPTVMPGERIIVIDSLKTKFDKTCKITYPLERWLHSNEYGKIFYQGRPPLFTQVSLACPTVGHGHEWKLAFDGSCNPTKAHGTAKACLFPPLTFCNGHGEALSMKNLSLTDANETADDLSLSAVASDAVELPHCLNSCPVGMANISIRKMYEQNPKMYEQYIRKQEPRPGEDRPPSAHFITPQQALKFCQNSLVPYEEREIVKYKKIYYVGEDAQKCSTLDSLNNYGNDDANGFYRIVIADHIAYRYEVIRLLGRGSFGQVIKAFDHRKRTFVALKIIRNQQPFHRQVCSEVNILSLLCRMDEENKSNTVRMIDHFTFRNHKCITFELLSISLYDVLRLSKYRGINLKIVRRFAFDILQCLDFLKRYGIIHCDLKPENIVLRQSDRTGVRVIDFGSSCIKGSRLYSYIQSRFYRAPEVILGCIYSTPIDMWSFGCILVELFTGNPLFPGVDETDQMALIIEMLGVPPPKLINGRRGSIFFDPDGLPKYCRNMNCSHKSKERGPPGSRSLRDVLKRCDNGDFIDFVNKCLALDPEERMTPKAALKHSWIRTKQSSSPSQQRKATVEPSDPKPSTDPSNVTKSTDRRRNNNNNNGQENADILLPIPSGQQRCANGTAKNNNLITFRENGIGNILAESAAGPASGRLKLPFL